MEKCQKREVEKLFESLKTLSDVWITSHDLTEQVCKLSAIPTFNELNFCNTCKISQKNEEKNDVQKLPSLIETSSTALASCLLKQTRGQTLNMERNAGEYRNDEETRLCALM